MRYKCYNFLAAMFNSMFADIFDIFPSARAYHAVVMCLVSNFGREKLQLCDSEIFGGKKNDESSCSLDVLAPSLPHRSG